MNGFNYEENLVKTFSSFLEKKQDIIIKEMPIRWGNIDIVTVKNNTIPFNTEQCKILSKPSAAKIFLKIKNQRPISKNAIMEIAGISNSTATSMLRELIKTNLIKKVDNFYYRNIAFEFPKVIITGFEAKLHDYNKAFFQASINKDYVDYSYIVFPMVEAIKIHNKNYQFLKDNGIGIIGVTHKKYSVLLQASSKNEIKKYVRLINLVQSYLLSEKALTNN
ncbi:MAG: hypothetical protein PHU94_02615 [Bacilli bacterium]|nr:hypothetical protein [Bacilli bacterium]MDD4734290.1 hypothetical protein [Bacilli bacterium]